MSSLMGTPGQQQLAGNINLATSAGRTPWGQQVEAVQRLLGDISPGMLSLLALAAVSLLGAH